MSVSEWSTLKREKNFTFGFGTSKKVGAFAILDNPDWVSILFAYNNTTIIVWAEIAK